MAKTLRELEEVRYLALLNDKRLQLGWIDEDTFFILTGTVSREMGFTHCFTGITAMESRKRAWTACTHGQEYYVKKQEITKIHPLLYWQPWEVQDFIRDQGIPVNPVYDKYGLTRTGCVCCTCYRGWREQLSRVNPKLYKIIMERYFDQVTF